MGTALGCSNRGRQVRSILDEIDEDPNRDTARELHMTSTRGVGCHESVSNAPLGEHIL